MSDSAVHNPEQPLSDAAVGAVVALVRVCELYDAAVAHRSALRAAVADALLEQSTETEIEKSAVIAAAALADIDLVINRPLDPEAASEESPSLLGTTLLEQVPGLGSVAAILGQQHERWDGSGQPDAKTGSDIDFAARLVAVTHALVGNPADGYLPTWDHALRRTDHLAGSALDPQLCTLLHSLDLDALPTSTSASALVLELLHTEPVSPMEPGRPVDTPAPDAIERPDDTEAATTTATTIKSAVAAAGHTDDLLSLFADSAQRTIAAADVVVLRLTATEFATDPVARATDGHDPELGPERFDDLREFSAQAELRAGATLERPAGSKDVHELVVPMHVADETWGVFIATRRPDDAPFDALDLSVLRHIATEAADAITSTTHWAQMERMALRDQLTGLANRHELYRVLDAIFERPPLERVDCALIMCDVDGLKIVNDTMGHQAGDRLLIDAAAALRGAVRDPERTTICRIGGDEFCLVIDGGALLTAHDVSDTIERLFARSAGSGPPRSISCGIAFAGEDIESRSALLRAADENQYQTKRARKASREAMIKQVEADAGPHVDRRAIRD